MIRVLALLWIAILASSLSPVAAQAAITWTVDATASGGDLNNMSSGDTLLIDITVRSDGEAVTSIGGSVYGFTVGDDAFLVGGSLADPVALTYPGPPGRMSVAHCVSEPSPGSAEKLTTFEDLEFAHQSQLQSPLSASSLIPKCTGQIGRAKV